MCTGRTGPGLRITAWKKTEEPAFLNEVSSVPLQQTLRYLQTAFTDFFAKRAKYPRFTSRKRSRRSAEYTTSGFRFRDGAVTPAKLTAPLDIVWSRPLPEGAQPSTVTVSQDAASARRKLSRKAKGDGANSRRARRQVVDRFFPSSRGRVTAAVRPSTENSGQAVGDEAESPTARAVVACTVSTRYQYQYQYQEEAERGHHGGTRTMRRVSRCPDLRTVRTGPRRRWGCSPSADSWW
ncbi:hypothetical protein GCM10011578_077230 [Streptomyces fuscichromogenes]|uniref:Transposase n=1 Tax=Streptomyces fuscichromogenes TaxID=1324013 RepID=A0A918CVY5_9ACTN|nr:hypothetical protein GCM10011578_077230 [Streptomyces fuscichromogenes]